jgi:hypothetical protein
MFEVCTMNVPDCGLCLNTTSYFPSHGVDGSTDVLLFTQYTFCVPKGREYCQCVPTSVSPCVKCLGLVTHCIRPTFLRPFHRTLYGKD